MKNILIGGAWPYANNSLHVGHLAALLPGDIIARFYRLNNDNVIYVSGTDAHGTPITLRSQSEKVEPVTIANRYHEEFTSDFNDLDFSYDLYTTTMTDYHAKNVQAYFKTIIDNGYIYEKETEQDYCLKCNKFLSDREIVGTCSLCGGVVKGDQCEQCLTILNSDQIINKKCKCCDSDTTLKLNKHLYFALSKFQGEVETLVNEKGSNWRKNALNETKKYLDMGLIDRAATRDLNWGVSVLVPGYEDKKIYVWFEAVLGYLTATKKVCEERNINFDDFIQNNTSYFVHGKDNITFHTIIYPALLKAIDTKISLPDYIISSEYVNMNDSKMSKSTGNLITIRELLNKYNKDTIRYYFIANGPEKKDINFSYSEFEQAHNKFLVGVLGNFINRNLSFINKKFNGHITKGNIDSIVKAKTVNLYEKTKLLIIKGDFKEALDNIINYASLGNKYYDENKPWELVNNDLNKFNDVTYTCVYIMANLSNLLLPFIPTTAHKIKDMLNIKESSFNEIVINEDIEINNLSLLFERI